MRTHLVTLALLVVAACGASSKPPAAAPAAPAAQTSGLHPGLNIRLTTIYVDDQEKALRFYTDVLGFAKKDDYSNDGYRWVTVTSAADPDSIELLLALDSDPAAKALQEAQFAQRHPAIMFYTADVKAAYERLQAAGATFTTPPTDVGYGSIIATLDDTCGNLVQLTQLAKH